MATSPDQGKQPVRRARPARRTNPGNLQDFRTSDPAQTRVTIALHHTTAEELEALVKREKRRQRRTAAAYWARHQEEAQTPAGRAAIRARILAAARARRADGRLLDSVDAAAAEAIRLELERRGIDLGYPPPYPQGTDVSGRWAGTTNRGTGPTITPHIPAAYARAVTAAAWQISGDAVTDLRGLWPGGRPGGSASDDYLELADQVVTPGDIYRDAIEALVTPEP